MVDFPNIDPDLPGSDPSLEAIRRFYSSVQNELKDEKDRDAFIAQLLRKSQQDRKDSSKRAEQKAEYTQREAQDRQEQRQRRADQTSDRRWKDYMGFLGSEFDELNENLKDVVDAVEDGGGGFAAGVIPTKKDKNKKASAAASAAAGAAAGTGVTTAANAGKVGKFGKILTLLGKGAVSTSRFLAPLAGLAVLDDLLGLGITGDTLRDRKKSGESFFNTESGGGIVGALTDSRASKYASYSAFGSGIGSFIPGVGTAAGAVAGLGVAAIVENIDSIVGFYEEMKTWSIEGTTDAIVSAIENFSVVDDVIEPVKGFFGDVKTTIIDPTAKFFSELTWEDFNPATLADKALTQADKLWTATKELYEGSWVESVANFGGKLASAGGRILGALGGAAVDAAVEIGETYFPETTAAIKGIANDALDFASSVADGAVEISKTVQNTAADLWEMVPTKEDVQAGIATAENLYNQLKTKAADIVNSVKQAAQDAWQWFPDTANYLGNQAENLYNTAKDKAVEIANTVKSWAQAAWDWIPSIGPTKSETEDLYNEQQEKSVIIADIVKEGAIAAWEWVPTRESIVSQAENLYNTTKEKAKGIVDSVKSTAQAAWDWLPTLGPTKSETEELYNDQQAKAVVITDIVKEGAIAAWEWVPTSESVVSQAENLYNSTKEKAKGILDSVTSGAKAVWDWIPSTDDLGITSGPTDIQETATGTTARVSTSIVDKAKSLWNLIPGLDDFELTSGPTDIQETAKGVTGRVSHKVVDKAVTAWNWLKDKAVDIDEKTLGIVGLFGSVKDKLKEFYESLAGGIDDFLEKNLGFRLFGTNPKVRVVPTKDGKISVQNNAGTGITVKEQQEIIDKVVKTDASIINNKNANKTINTLNKNYNQAQSDFYSQPLNTYSNNTNPKLLGNLENKDQAQVVEKETKDGGKIQKSPNPIRRPPIPSNSNTPMLPDDRGLSIFSIYDF